MSNRAEKQLLDEERTAMDILRRAENRVDGETRYAMVAEDLEGGADIRQDLPDFARLEDVPGYLMEFRRPLVFKHEGKRSAVRRYVSSKPEKYHTPGGEVGVRLRYREIDGIDSPREFELRIAGFG